MLLSSLLDPEFIKPKIKAATKDEVIQVLLDEMFGHYQFQLSRKDVHEAISAREALKGTVFPSGIAIPHARIELFNDILIGIASLKTPIVEDGVEIRLIVLILTSKTTSNLYLNCLSSFIKISQDKAVFDKLCAAGNPHDVIAVIQSVGSEVRPELTIENIMTKDVVSVPPQTPIREVIDLFIENDVSYLPIVERNGTFLGEITVLEILKLGIPNYAQMIGNINFLKTFEPMEELLAKEDKIVARDVMEPPTNSFTRQTSIVEAVFTFTKTRKRQIPVLDKQQLAGVVSYMDVLKKVLRG